MAGLDELSIELWSSFVERIQDVIRAGLERLSADAAAKCFSASCENDLNRELFFRIRRIAAEQKKGLFAAIPRPALCSEHTWNLAPVHEANDQPSPDDPERTPREQAK